MIRLHRQTEFYALQLLSPSVGIVRGVVGLILTTVLALTSTGCPADVGTATDTHALDISVRDSGLDAGANDVRADTTQEGTTCKVFSTEPATFELGAAHDLAILIECVGTFSAPCVAGSCAQLERPARDGSPSLRDAGVELLGQDAAGATYAVHFSGLASPSPDVNADGVPRAVGVEPLTLLMNELDHELSLSIRWHMSAAGLSALNVPDPDDLRLPEALRGSRTDPDDPERVFGLRAIRAGASLTANAEERTLLLGAKGAGDKVHLLMRAPKTEADGTETEVETLATLLVDPSTLQNSAFDVIPNGSGGHTVHFNARKAGDNSFVGVFAELDADGALVASGSFDGGDAQDIAGIYAGRALSYASGSEVLLNIAFQSDGKLVALSTSRTPGTDTAPVVRVLAIRARHDGDVDERAIDYESVGIVDPKVTAEDTATAPTLWFVSDSADGLSIAIVTTEQVTTNGAGDALRVTETVITHDLDFVKDPSTLRVERLVKRNGVVVGLVAHADGGVLLLQPDPQGTWSNATMLPAPKGLGLGLDTEHTAGQSASTSFVLNGHQLVALGRWPWNWRDKLEFTQDAPTFAARWDLTSQELLSVSLARIAASKDRDGVPNLDDLVGTTSAQSLSAGGTIARSGTLDTDSSCVEAGDCVLLSSLPTGERLYLAGGSEGPTLRTGKYGDILIDGVPLEFDLIGPNGLPQYLRGAPKLVARPGGGAFILMPVGHQGGTGGQAIIWLMSPDGTVTTTKSVVSKVLSAVNLANDRQQLVASVDGLEVAVPDGDREDAPGEATFSIVTAADLAAVAAATNTALDVRPSVGAVAFKDASFHVAERQRRARHGPVFFARAESITEPASKHLGGGAGAARRLDVTVTGGALLAPDARVLLAHLGEGCGALTLATIDDLGSESPHIRPLLERAPVDADCADAEVIIGAGRFLTADAFAIATYLPTTHTIVLTYLVGDGSGSVSAHTATYASLDDVGATIPRFRVADTNGDGLDDIIAEGAWQDGVRVVLQGDGAGVVQIAPVPPLAFQSLAGDNQGATPSGPAGSPGPTVQFAGMASGGPSGTVTSVGVYTKVVAGGTHSCALKATGAIICWGADDQGQSSPPPGTFKDVSAGSDAFSCGLEATGAIVCWGSNAGGQATPPPGTFKKIASGNTASCGIRTDDTLVCWGNQPPVTTPAGTYIDVAIAGSGVCALAIDQTVTCWGGVLLTDAVPTGTFGDVAMGRNAWACGVRTDGTAECWAAEAGLPQPPPGNYTQIAVGFAHACGIKTDGTLDCWGVNTLPKTDMPSGTFVQINSGPFHLCGVRTDGSIACWGRNVIGETIVPTGAWRELYPGMQSTCGMRDDGTVGCWGVLTSWPGPSTAATFSTIGPGTESVCGIETDGAISCWGRLANGEGNSPAGTFTQVGVGVGHGCALRSDGTATCWGGIAPPPTGTFKMVVSGWYYGCGLTGVDTVVCWGMTSTLGAIPSGTFMSLEPGPVHMCGLRANGDAECWGAGNYLRAVAPPGTFTQLAAGAFHSCGLKPDGSIQCWGTNQHGALDSPSGAFTEIRSGYGHVCAKRADGTHVCWGTNVFGEATIPN